MASPIHHQRSFSADSDDGSGSVGFDGEQLLNDIRDEMMDQSNENSLYAMRVDHLQVGR